MQNRLINNKLTKLKKVSYKVISTFRLLLLMSVSI